MFLIIGALVVIGVIYLLLKRHESRMVLIAAGILMCCIAGKPMASLDAFAKSGWRIVVVACVVFTGTYIGSAIIAQTILKALGQI